MDEPELLIVRWRDNWYRDGWHACADTGPVICTTIGWAVSTDDGVLVLAQSRNESGQYGNTQGIIEGCIVSIEAVTFEPSPPRRMRAVR